ncbi:purine operon repressor PurR [Ruminiclostridium sufflavum DSM 19573]|uniref:Purine operon repressor PurR n=1 Tax=Ruminiclostridium sufflavum DSM 19573 TaxID=1121337 RepID=A0A318XQU8_9FIRM|nr:pur operon repressor [Ruminiclostridium sufflavum]PYG88272.1 purine operon repressor PurR [Ruminiclostridium sufflavum DSM 19573]
MDKIQRNERLTIIMKTLCDNPNRIFTLGYFSGMFGSAKSTISEDLDFLQKTFQKNSLGNIITISGASGGVKYVPFMNEKDIQLTLDELSRELSNQDRVLPGGYIYILDIIYNPEWVNKIAMIFASKFCDLELDYVITVETKGIPLAFATAQYLDVPLVIVRHYNVATDGASVNINYLSGSSKKIQTMVLPVKSLKKNSKILFIDDFMKGGGTSKGIIEMANQFESEVVGIGVLIETNQPEKKLVGNYYSLVTLNSCLELQENTEIDIKPSK